MKQTLTFQDYIASYIDSVDCHRTIQREFFEGTNSDPDTKAHRDFIEESYKNGIIYGHGNRELQYMWKLIVDELPESFNFLEIGVYKGQIISLIQLLADKANKKPLIVGVTPLYDKDFADYNRLPWIQNLYKHFNLTMKNTYVLDGLSTQSRIIEEVYNKGPFDVVYVDGDHSYKGAKFDIETYDTVLKPGGYMVVDDAANYKKIEGQSFTGIIEVSDAVRDTLEQNPNYKEVLTVMHNRVFKKLK